MTSLIVVILMLAFVISLYWFRINAAIVFLSLCLGEVLTQFVSPDAHSLLTLFSAHVPSGADTSNLPIKIILLLLPPVLTALFMIGTIKHGPSHYLNLLPAIGTGLLIALLLPPLLPSDLSGSIINSSLWSQLKANQASVVGISGLVCLILLWLQRPKSRHVLLRGRPGKHKD